MLFASTIIKVAAVLAIASQAVFAAPATGRAGGAGGAGSSTQNIQQQALTSHNNYRSRHHVAGLRWSQKLADHATQVSKSCVWGHSVMPGTGQNIAYGYPSMTAVVDVWYNEVVDYNYNTGTSLNGKATGHFTQVVWKGTTEVGCGATYCSNLGGTFYVCDYSPPGNYYGQYTANVFKP